MGDIIIDFAKYIRSCTYDYYIHYAGIIAMSLHYSTSSTFCIETIVYFINWQKSGCISSNSHTY